MYFITCAQRYFHASSGGYSKSKGTFLSVTSLHRHLILIFYLRKYLSPAIREDVFLIFF